MLVVGRQHLTSHHDLVKIEHNNQPAREEDVDAKIGRRVVIHPELCCDDTS